MTQEHINVHDKHGNVIGGFPFMALAPLVASAVGPLLNKILGNGVHSISHPKFGHHQLRKTKETKKGGSPFTPSESYLVPHIHSVHGTGAMGMGAMGMGAKGGLPLNLGIKGNIGGGKSYFQGYQVDSPVQYGSTTYPQGGAMGFGAMGFGTHKKGGARKKHSKKGGYAVDQMHSNVYSGFTPGTKQAMFPVNMGG